MTTNELTLREKMRAAHVKRWHLVRVLREQNIAEHSFVVALIATEIMKRSDQDPDQMGAIHGPQGYTLLRWAMWHDLVETKTGDIATPTKRRIDSLAPGLIDEIEKEFSGEFKRISDDTGMTVKHVVKLADMLEAITFYQEEGVGERKAEVLGGLTDALAKYLSDMPNMFFLTVGSATMDIASELGIEMKVER